MKHSPFTAAISAPRLLCLSRPARWLLPLAVCAGASLGTLAAHYLPQGLPSRVLSLADAVSVESVGYFRLLWIYSFPCLLAVVLSATLFGFILLPWIFLFRGFLLSFSVATLLSGGASAAAACWIIGVPALFSLSSLFLLGEEAFCSSLDIYRTCRGYPHVRFSLISVDRLLLAALLITAAAFVRQFLIPLIL